jgi:hypothetical protein
MLTLPPFVSSIPGAEPTPPSGGAPGEQWATPPNVPAFALSPLPADGEVQRYRVAGPLTFASMLALERAVSRLDGVTYARLVPSATGEATLAFLSADPDSARRTLLSLPGFRMQLDSS